MWRRNALTGRSTAQEMVVASHRQRADLQSCAGGAARRPEYRSESQPQTPRPRRPQRSPSGRLTMMVRRGFGLAEGWR